MHRCPSPSGADEPLEGPGPSPRLRLGGPALYEQLRRRRPAPPHAPASATGQQRAGCRGGRGGCYSGAHLGAGGGDCGSGRGGAGRPELVVGGRRRLIVAVGHVWPVRGECLYCGATPGGPSRQGFKESGLLVVVANIVRWQSVSTYYTHRMH
eukprot:scaffold13404_cov118-Isochrysis_galbana.AAC.1